METCGYLGASAHTPNPSMQIGHLHIVINARFKWNSGQNFKKWHIYYIL